MMQTNNEDRERLIKPKKSRWRRLKGISSWWRRRRNFYNVVQDHSIEDDVPIVDMTVEDSFEVELQLSDQPVTKTSKALSANDSTTSDEAEDFLPASEISPIKKPSSPPTSPLHASLRVSTRPPLPTASLSAVAATTAVRAQYQRRQEQQLSPTRSLTAASIAASTASTRQRSIATTSPLPMQSRFSRSRTKDSFQGSLESIDSLQESCWDPEDDASLATPVVTNVARPIDFREHVDFLRVQTQPKIELVWSKVGGGTNTATARTRALSNP